MDIQPLRFVYWTALENSWPLTCCNIRMRSADRMDPMPSSFHGYQSLVENSPDAISLINRYGEILFSNSSAVKLLGYRPHELVGRNCLELMQFKDRQRFGSLLNELVRWPTGPRTLDASIRRKDGTCCWVESTVINLLDDSEVQAIVMYQSDIHERIEAQEKSKIQAKELKNSNARMEEFAYTVAHDLREPLRAISVYTQLLFANAELDVDQEQMAQFIIDGSGRMGAMVSDLLAFARAGMAAPAVKLSLEDAVEHAMQNLALEIKESAAVVTVAPLPEVFSDKVHLARVFQNLISNAIKYRSERPLSIAISSQQQENDYVIRVRDNGVGIAASYQTKIFRPFIRLASRQIPGTGLGLAVCKKAIEGLGGAIWVESDLGIGSTFAFSIPKLVAPPVVIAQSAG